MPLSRACRYCRSPARRNPCWYFLDHPEYATSGGDPPCFEDDEYVRWIGRRRKRRRRGWPIFFVLVILACAAAVLLFSLKIAVGCEGL